MRTIYREVLVKERLPKNNATYFTSEGSAEFINGNFEQCVNQYYSTMSKVYPEYWLEEIEFPFDEMEQEFIKIMSETYNAGSYDKYETIDGIMKWMKDFVLAVAPLTSNTNSH